MDTKKHNLIAALGLGRWRRSSRFPSHWQTPPSPFWSFILGGKKWALGKQQNECFLKAPPSLVSRLFHPFLYPLFFFVFPTAFSSVLWRERDHRSSEVKKGKNERWRSKVEREKKLAQLVWCRTQIPQWCSNVENRGWMWEQRIAGRGMKWKNLRQKSSVWGSRCQDDICKR